MFSQANFKGFDMVCMGSHNQSSLHFFLTNSDKIFFCYQNSLTSGYRQDKKNQNGLGCHDDQAWHIYNHLSSQLLPVENSSWIHRRSRMWPCPQQPYTHQYKFLASISEVLLFWSNLILTLVPQISTGAGRH